MKRIIFLFAMLFAQWASAAVIDFEGVGEVPIGISEITVPQGYTLATEYPETIVRIADNEGGCGHVSYEGPAPDAPFFCPLSVGKLVHVDLWRIDGALFSVSQLDAYLFDTSESTVYTSEIYGDSFLLQAWDADDNLVNELTVSAAATGFGWQTLVLGPGWTGIERFRITSQEILCACELFTAPVIDNIDVNVVPLPPALWLFGSAIAALYLRRSPAQQTQR